MLRAVAGKVSLRGGVYTAEEPTDIQKMSVAKMERRFFMLLTDYYNLQSTNFSSINNWESGSPLCCDSDYGDSFQFICLPLHACMHFIPAFPFTLFKLLFPLFSWNLYIQIQDVDIPTNQVFNQYSYNTLKSSTYIYRQSFCITKCGLCLLGNFTGVIAV